MENSVKAFKAALSAAVSLLTTLWGWFGWLMVGWILCMALDIATGMAAGLRAGEWSSKKAREGLLHKAGCVAAVTAAAEKGHRRPPGQAGGGHIGRDKGPGHLPRPFCQ